MSASELRRPILSCPHGQFRVYSVQNFNGDAYCLHEITKKKYPFPIHHKLFIIVLVLMLIIGSAIGIYLIATEGHVCRGEKYNISSRELWQAHAPSSSIPKLNLPIQNLVFLQTHSNHSCNNTLNCAQQVKRLQTKHMLQSKADILYNFVVSQNGDIFEGRGWHFRSDIFNSSFSAIAVAFLGRYQSGKQVESIEAFVRNALSERKIRQCFNVVVVESNRLIGEIARHIQGSLSDCDTRENII